MSSRDARGRSNRVFRIHLLRCNRGIARDLRQRLSSGMNIVAGEEEVDAAELRPVYEKDELDELVSSRVFPR